MQDYVGLSENSAALAELSRGQQVVPISLAQCKPSRRRQAEFQTQILYIKFINFCNNLAHQ